MDIKIEAQTVVANEGGFEPHPESYTPRVFAAVRLQKGKVYEILQNGQAIPWPTLPNRERFVLFVEYLSDVDSAPKPEPKKFWAGTNIPYDQPCPLSVALALLGNHDPVPQADGDDGRSGDLSHLPEGSH
jgi:hypothetical protein